MARSLLVAPRNDDVFMLIFTTCFGFEPDFSLEWLENAENIREPCWLSERSERGSRSGSLNWTRLDWLDVYRLWKNETLLRLSGVLMTDSTSGKKDWMWLRCSLLLWHENCDLGLEPSGGS